MSNSIGDMLGDARKKLDKSLITTFTASHAVASAENREQLTKEAEKEKTETFKNNDKKHIEKLKSAIKGNWFKAAQKALENTRNKCNDI
ncbi:hypothetical protein [Listeria sp. ILCC792]|uniref:hypothetical protein n=1 Tax=Listeria sp. ILCC792 TaxID=1918331 RepID=UPI000B58DE65|nr:hypothetical protein [Listeria sp. ILCC792]